MVSGTGDDEGFEAVFLASGISGLPFRDEEDAGRGNEMELAPGGLDQVDRNVEEATRNGEAVLIARKEINKESPSSRAFVWTA